MSQIIETIGNYSEYVGVMAGAGAGLATEYIASRNVSNNRSQLSGEIGIALQEPEVSRLRRVGALALTPIVFAGASLGLLNNEVWEPNDIEAQSPKLGIVVDHSGATEMGDQPAIGSINLLTASFDNPNEVEATAYVAGSGAVETAQPTEVGEDEPFGNAPLADGFNQAVDKIEETRRKEIGNQSASGVLVITNGNTFGNNADILARTEAENIPVFVANVEGETTNPSSVEGFKEVTKQTNGEYFDVEEANVEEMVDQISDSLEESRLKNPAPNDWPKRILAGALTVATFGLYRKKRSSMTLDSNSIGR